jgi:predicted ATP-grasp superfamily ATP-dependent carboligase
MESDTPVPAVIVGLDCITGLQSARILARHGVPVIGVATDARHACARTRVVERVIAANTGTVALIDALVELGPRLTRRAVLFPCTDASVLLIARHREMLQSWFHVALPDTDTVEVLMDKLRFGALAEELGLPVPATRMLHDRMDAERAAAELTFPCIMKPALKTPLWVQHSSTKVHSVATPEELLEHYDRYAAYAEAGMIVQQWIPGPESELYSCNCYFDSDSQPLVTFVAKKLRQWPPGIGTSCLGEECRNDEVLDLTLRLFTATDYCGLGYVEVKRDTRTGAHYIIEPNIGRPTGRSAIAEAGGVELLYTMYCDVLGLPLPAARTQQYGHAKWIYWRQDMRSAFHYWRRGELSLREWAASWRGRKASAVLSWSDPLPFLADFVNLSTRVQIRRSGRSAPSRPVTATAPADDSKPSLQRV